MANLFCGPRTAGVLLLAAVSLARAEVMYQCVDDLGHKIFSNVKLPDKSIRCTTLDLGPTIPIPASPKPPAGAASPPDFPTVSKPLQDALDKDRQYILENELRAERQNLEQARKELAEQESLRNGDLKKYKDKVALHERNIEAIENELSRLARPRPRVPEPVASSPARGSMPASK